MFHTFVNKFAQICDFEPKGNTVSAIAIIWQDGRICYVASSNRGTRGRLKNARAALTAVLGILKSNLEAKTSESDEVMKGRLVREVLRWNSVRVRSYLTSLSKASQACMKRCDDSHPDGMSARKALEKWACDLPDTNQDGQKSENYIGSTMHCIKTLHENRKSPLQRYIQARAVEDDKMATGGCWSTLRHAAGRLLSYQYAVQTLVHAHRIWADTDLFRDFDVKSLRSSGSYPAQALDLKPETAEAVINRAPGGPSRTQSWRYIGSSKLICRLCQHYFNVIATPVRFRSGHLNTYLNWRLPDIYVDEGDEGSIERERKTWYEVLGQMKGQVYAAVARVLEEKVSDRKPHDSNTHTDRITGAGDPNHLANWIENMQLK
ncbi:hypothetical protein VTI74DRAFT_856 [Chaetomium olivicolor]